MQTIPRDENPVWAKPPYPISPKDRTSTRTMPSFPFTPKDSVQKFSAIPIPPILPDAPSLPDLDSTDQSMIIKGIHDDRPVAISVDEDGRLLIDSDINNLSTQVISVPVDAPVIYRLDGSGPANVAVTPGSGGSMAVEFQIAEGGVWRAWPSGTVSVDTVGRLIGQAHALRFTATTVAGTAEVAQ